MTPREAAKNFIRAYVLRGDEIGYLLRSGMGSYNGEYSASIGGFLNERPDLDWDPKYIKKVPSDKIAVLKVGKKTVNETFKLKEIYDEILLESKQKTLFK